MPENGNVATNTATDVTARVIGSVTCIVVPAQSTCIVCPGTWAIGSVRSLARTCSVTIRQNRSYP